MLLASQVFSLTALLWAVIPFVGASNQPRGFKKPLTPSVDPFYTPDDGWELTPPGTILKSRRVAIASIVQGVPTALESAHQLLYRTTNGRGLPNYAMNTVLIPYGAQLDLLASYHVGYDSPNNDCSPSYGIQLGASTNSSETLIELVVGMLPYLKKGIPLSVPDYLQRTAAFMVGQSAAYAVLDSLRAVRNSKNITGISEDAITTIHGYSQGALAALYAGLYRRSYAPDVRIDGAALGGMPTNISEVFYAVEKTISAGLAAASLMGIAHVYPELRAYIDKHLLPKYRPLYEITQQECIADFYKPVYGYAVHLIGQNVSTWFDNGRAIISDNIELFNFVGVPGLLGKPDFPMFIWRGTDDEVAVGIEEHDALVQRYCDEGLAIEYLRVHKTLHTPTIPFGLPGAHDFAARVFKGKPPTKCTTNDLWP
ncbi:putative lipase 8 precursor [Aspergillus homomorphus CBS 101889]|uniref:Putative lipase 8 n=1 Tax=Aspergillus homomorphus (strain CBS 101889) TaxID=1450537 RepID=A0A395I9I4_ASPHC|nr:putative lipase 8 precursor [Aspergillus homomorphus CBS 101889]RAL15883.1 putative lipase 8 precursor [Aspergillus homomorphus CBS 101889]